MAKPDPAVYHLTGERLRVEPHEVVFLDDHETCVRAAQDLGWHAVLHRSTPESTRAITAILRAEAG